MKKIYRFLNGRYGLDDLSNFLLKVYFIIILVNIFFRLSLLSYIELFILVLIIYRSFSKRKYKRNNENLIFIKYRNKITGLFKNLNDSNYIYRKCNKCNTKMRLPLPDSRGIKTVKCPCCNKRIKFLILRKLKVEVIRN